MTSKDHCSSDEMNSVVRKSLLGPVKISCPSERGTAILHWVWSGELEHSGLPFPDLPPCHKSITHYEPPKCTVVHWIQVFAGISLVLVCVLGKHHSIGDKSLSVLSFVAILCRLIWESKLIHELCFHIRCLAAVWLWHSRHWPELTALSCLPAQLFPSSAHPLCSLRVIPPLQLGEQRDSRQWPGSNQWEHLPGSVNCRPRPQLHA